MAWPTVGVVGGEHLGQDEPAVVAGAAAERRSRRHAERLDGQAEAVRSGSSLGRATREQSRRTSRCETTAQQAAPQQVGLDAHVRQPADRAGGAAGVEGAEDECPVSDAWNAASAVARSRISPTAITSGSCRMSDRRPGRQVNPAAG